MYKSNFVTGKVILAGEHAAVYGKMALAASISLGATIKVVDEVFEKTDLVKKAIEVAGGNESIQVKIESDLPIGSGLGSSAVVAAATINAVREYLGKPINKDELFKLTMECERLAHGNPSGLDPTTVIYGGLIAFTKGQPFERLNILKSIKLLLVNSGKPEESTKEMIELVANNINKDEIIDRIGDLTIEFKKMLESGQDISAILNQNGLMLEELGVVGAKAVMLSKEIRNLGGSVKIVGAGGARTGSGMMIVMAPDYTKIMKLLDNKQIDYFETTIGAK
jgi:mevalonate kinase